MKSNSNLVYFLMFCIIILLGFSQFQIKSKENPSNQIVQLTQDMTEETNLKNELVKNYTEANVQLEEMKGSNFELNNIIDNKKFSIRSSRFNIRLDK